MFGGIHQSRRVCKAKNVLRLNIFRSTIVQNYRSSDFEKTFLTRKPRGVLSDRRYFANGGGA